MNHFTRQHDAFLYFSAGNDQFNDLSGQKAISGLNKKSTFAYICNNTRKVSVLAGEDGGSTKWLSGKSPQINDAFFPSIVWRNRVINFHGQYP